MDKRAAKRMDRFTQFAVAAAKQAMEMSGVKVEEEDENRIGVILGSGIGGIETFEQQCNVLRDKGPGRVSPFFIPMQIPNMAAGQIAIEYGIKGVNHVVVSACASGTDAVGEAFRHIKHGYSDIVLTGGAEAPDYADVFCRILLHESHVNNRRPVPCQHSVQQRTQRFCHGRGRGNFGSGRTGTCQSARARTSSRK